MTPNGIQPQIMGILNVTPDSFSDGGQYQHPELAARRLEELFEDGSDIVDIGAESTRPGASDIAELEEWERLKPILDYAKQSNMISRISVDTRRFSTMARAAAMGVGLINTVGPIPEVSNLKNLFQSHPNLKFIACHMHGSPKTMQDNPIGPASAIKRVKAYFESVREDLRVAGCRNHHIFLDPGIGFGKSDSANVALLIATASFAREFQTVIGVSRKGFLTRMLAPKDMDSRDVASKAVEAFAAVAGVKMIRTHNVKALRPILQTIDQLPLGVVHG